MKKIIVLLAVGIGCLTALAQDEDGKQSPEAIRKAINVSNLKFDLTFAGGTPAQLVTAIKQAGERTLRVFTLNVFIPPDLKEIKIPAMELRSVDAKSIFQSLNMLARNDATGIEWLPAGSDVWVLSRRQDNRPTQAFYVGNLLHKFKIDDITTAVQTTWQLGSSDGASARAELKYHQDTQLLIARAYPQQLSTMSEVLSQLKLAVDPNAAESRTNDAKKVRQ